MLEKEKEKTRKIEKDSFQKKQKDSVFWVVVSKRFFFAKMASFIGKHYWCSEGKISAHVR